MAQNITCDCCKKDLNTPSSMPSFRLRLTAEEKPTGGLVKAVIVYPPIDEDKHFCNLACLWGWISHMTLEFPDLGKE